MAPRARDQDLGRRQRVATEVSTKVQRSPGRTIERHHDDNEVLLWYSSPCGDIHERCTRFGSPSSVSTDSNVSVHDSAIDVRSQAANSAGQSPSSSSGASHYGSRRGRWRDSTSTTSGNSTATSVEEELDRDSQWGDSPRSHVVCISGRVQSPDTIHHQYYTPAECFSPEPALDEYQSCPALPCNEESHSEGLYHIFEEPSADHQASQGSLTASTRAALRRVAGLPRRFRDYTRRYRTRTKQFACPLCPPERPVVAADLISHIGDHLKDLRHIKHTCGKCDLTFVHIRDLRYHQSMAKRTGNCGFHAQFSRFCAGHHDEADIGNVAVASERSSFASRILHWEQAQLRRFTSFCASVQDSSVRPGESDSWSLDMPRRPCEDQDAFAYDYLPRLSSSYSAPSRNSYSCRRYRESNELSAEHTPSQEAERPSQEPPASPCLAADTDHVMWSTDWEGDRHAITIGLESGTQMPDAEHLFMSSSWQDTRTLDDPLELTGNFSFSASPSMYHPPSDSELFLLQYLNYLSRGNVVGFDESLTQTGVYYLAEMLPLASSSNVQALNLMRGVLHQDIREGRIPCHGQAFHDPVLALNRVLIDQIGAYGCQVPSSQPTWSLPPSASGSYACEQRNINTCTSDDSSSYQPDLTGLSPYPDYVPYGSSSSPHLISAFSKAPELGDDSLLACGTMSSTSLSSFSYAVSNHDPHWAVPTPAVADLSAVFSSVSRDNDTGQDASLAEVDRPGVLHSDRPTKKRRIQPQDVIAGPSSTSSLDPNAKVPQSQDAEVPSGATIDELVPIVGHADSSAQPTDDVDRTLDSRSCAVRQDPPTKVDRWFSKLETPKSSSLSVNVVEERADTPSSVPNLSSIWTTASSPGRPWTEKLMDYLCNSDAPPEQCDADHEDTVDLDLRVEQIFALLSVEGPPQVKAIPRLMSHGATRSGVCVSEADIGVWLLDLGIAEETTLSSYMFKKVLSHVYDSIRQTDDVRLELSTLVDSLDPTLQLHDGLHSASATSSTSSDFHSFASTSASLRQHGNVTGESSRHVNFPTEDNGNTGTNHVGSKRGFPGQASRDGPSKKVALDEGDGNPLTKAKEQLPCMLKATCCGQDPYISDVLLKLDAHAVKSEEHAAFICGECYQKFDTNADRNAHRCLKHCIFPQCERNRGITGNDAQTVLSLRHEFMSGCPNGKFKAKDRWRYIYALLYPDSDLEDMPRTRQGSNMPHVPHGTVTGRTNRSSPQHAELQRLLQEAYRENTNLKEERNEISASKASADAENGVLVKQNEILTGKINTLQGLLEMCLESFGNQMTPVFRGWVAKELPAKAPSRTEHQQQPTQHTPPTPQSSVQRGGTNAMYGQTPSKMPSVSPAMQAMPEDGNSTAFSPTSMDNFPNNFMAGSTNNLAPEGEWDLVAMSAMMDSNVDGNGNIQ